MKRGGKTLVCLLCAGTVTTGVKALVNDASTGGTPYSAIWQRNVFDLKPPPPPPPPLVPTGPPVNVQLKGITTMLGVKRAVIDVLGGKSGKPESYIMREQERQDGLEILEINLKAANVKIRNDGIESTITFLTNAVATAMPGSPAPMIGGNGFGGGIVRPPNLNLPPPGFNPSAAPLNSGGYTPTPVRQLRTTDNSVTPQSGYVQSSGISAGYAQPVVTPGLNIGNLLTQAPPSPGLITPMPANVPPIEDQIANLIQQHQLHDNVEVAAGTMPPLPPIPARYGGSDALTPPPPPSLPMPGGNSSIAPPAPPAFTPSLPAWLKARATGTMNQSQ